MKIFTFLLTTLTLNACLRHEPTQPQSGILIQEKTQKQTNDPANLPLPQTGGGNFENMVADFESKDRVIWQKPELVISMLGDLKGKTVADIGAGTGFFAFRLVPVADKVIGIDIDQRFIAFLDSVKVKLPQNYRDRFETRLAKTDDPLLYTAEVDDVTLVNTYGYIENRIAYLKTVQKGIKPNGQLLIIDFKKNNLPVGPSDEFKVDVLEVQKELREAGFSIKKVDTQSLDYQYIILAGRN